MTMAKASHVPESPLHRPLPHESGLRHVTGEALYIDDLPSPKGLLHGWPVASPHARARILSRHAERARAMPGVQAVLFAEDIPGENQIGPVRHDEPLLAEGEVFAEGQLVGLVLADSLERAREAARLVDVEYELLEPLLDLHEAIRRESFHSDPHVMRRGDVEAALAAAPHRFSGEVENGGQEHFYLETNVALALPEEGGALRILTSSQHPTEVQAKVAEVLHRPRHLIVCEVPRMGGGFGGKETQGAAWAALAALGAVKTRRPVKVWLNRDQDMTQTGKRHPFLTRYDAGFAKDGTLVALKAQVFANGGWSLDLSHSILDRGLFHLGNCYWLENLRFEGRVAKTNVASNTAFRGFGGPQGMLAMEMILTRAAEELGLDPLEVRRKNFLGHAPRNRLPYGQEVDDFRIPRIVDELVVTSDYAKRRAAIEAFNETSPYVKRGIALQPVQFGISFTHTPLNQAGALVHIYQDGSVQVNHGGTEMGQGLHTKMRQVAAHGLGVDVERVRVMTTATDKVPNTSATAASSGADLNGQAVRLACEELVSRLRPVAARLLGLNDAASLVFAGGTVCQPETGASVPFEKVAFEAWFAQVSLSATGFYRTPGIGYDAKKGEGRPFYYFAYGAAVVEVELSTLTGEHRVRRADILHDAGDSLSPAVDQGQVEGAFIQGLGWLTCEELVWSPDGRLLTHSPDTYKIPAIGEAPEDFRVALLEQATQAGVVHGSKAVGEPPLMHAIAAVSALRHALQSVAGPGRAVELPIPCTPEAVLRGVASAEGRSPGPRFAVR
ncbi:MAG: xanthine dehydrogenase molybdopterin binding subunit [Pseudomonadota bacterium]|jgi:xanthine dehydrogenase large subunit